MRSFGLLGVHLPDELDAALARHRHVEQQHVELEPAHPLDHLGARRRLGDHLDVARGGPSSCFRPSRTMVWSSATTMRIMSSVCPPPENFQRSRLSVPLPRGCSRSATLPPSEVGALLQAEQAVRVGLARRLRRRSPCRRRAPCSTTPSAPRSSAHLTWCASACFGDVGEGLLEHAEDRGGVRIGAAPGRRPASTSSHGVPVRCAEVLHQPLARRDEAQVVEHERAQVRRRCAASRPPWSPAVPASRRASRDGFADPTPRAREAIRGRS